MRRAWVLLLGLVPAGAGACGFDGLMGPGLTAMHPRSIEVAIAVREAADRKLIDAALLDPKAAGALGYLRATARLRQFALVLEKKPTAVLFVESGLWTRFENGVPQFHAAGAADGDEVIVTSEAVVAAILDQRMSIPQAVEKGLLVR